MRELNDITISRAIIEQYSKDLLDYLDVDVAIAGAGPAGLVAAYYLAKVNKKVAIFERRLSIGGGMWAGGMMFNHIVIQEDAKAILEDIGIKVSAYKENYYTADSVHAATGLAYKATDAGAKIFNCISVEDVYFKNNRVSGFVINWSTTKMTGLLVDPLTIKAKACVDGTGHDASVVNQLITKNQVKLETETGGLMGEQGMWADVAEPLIVKNTKEIYPGLWVTGMACAATFGGPRMGPIFGGMLLSGKKIADNLRDL